MYIIVPKSINVAPVNFMYGHSFIGKIEVFAPVKKDKIAKTTSIPTQHRFPIKNATSDWSLNIARKRGSKPRKQRAKPSAIHSIVIMFLLSSERLPKPSTILFVGKRCPTPQRKIIIEPTYSITISDILIIDKYSKMLKKLM